MSTGDLSARVRDLWTSWKDLIAPWLAPVGAVLGVISPLGWFVLTGGVLAWIGAGLLGWVELAYAAAGLLVLFTLAALLTIGRTSLEVEARIEPQRVVAGESAVAEVRVRNVGKGPLLPVPLDLPTGDSVTRFALPLLGPGSDFEDLVRLPTSRRGVFVIGPARSVRGDPLGIARRELVWTEPVEFFVHPRTVFLDSLGSGLLKDLEGQSTNDISMSDLAFHTLREYAPGDDVRHIHWKSSAKRLASGSDTFLVRQFLDTRRSHIGLLVDCAETSSGSIQRRFEMAVAAGASIARRALRDEMELSQASGPFIITRPSRREPGCLVPGPDGHRGCGTRSSPAVAGGHQYLRSDHHYWPLGRVQLLEAGLGVVLDRRAHHRHPGRAGRARRVEPGWRDDRHHHWLPE